MVSFRSTDWGRTCLYSLNEEGCTLNDVVNEVGKERTGV